MTAFSIDPKQAAPIIRATFPGYAGRMVRIVPSSTVTFHDLNWSGGTRNQYRACRLDGAPLPSRVAMNAPAPWENPYEGHTVEIPQGAAVVEHTIFCGKDLGLRIHARQEDLAPMLPAPVELTPFEVIVLKYTAERKSSYNGKDRYDMAADDSKYGYSKIATMPTRAEWESAKQALIARGMLNKAGAITISGKNAHATAKGTS